MLEVEKQRDTKSGYFQIIENLANFVIGDGVDGFGIHDNGIRNDQIRDILADQFAFIENIVVRLLTI